MKIEYSLSPDLIQENGLFGIVGRTLTASCALALGRVFGTYLLRNGQHIILVCRDNRVSSVRLEEELVRGLALSGAQVLRLAAIPLPVLQFAMSVLKIPEGIMVTGCDKPMIYNGFKIFCDGVSVSYKTLDTLIKASAMGDWVDAPGCIVETEVRSAYVQSIINHVSEERRNIYWNLMGGVSGSVVSLLTEKLKNNLHIVENSTLMEYDITPDPYQIINLLQKKVAEEKYDIVVAIDGDGHKALLINKNGSIDEVIGDPFKAVLL